MLLTVRPDAEERRAAFMLRCLPEVWPFRMKSRFRASRIGRIPYKNGGRARTLKATRGYCFHLASEPTMFSDLIGQRVLVVEDDYLQAVDMTLALEEQGSDLVRPFPDLDGGLTALNHASIDAAVLDVHLRYRHVFQFADCLMKQDIPFLFVTGYDPIEIPERVIGVQCLLKPVEPGEIMVRLAAVVAGHARRH